MNMFRSTATSFSPKHTTSSGYNNTRKWVHIETENYEAGDLPFYIKVHLEHILTMQIKNSKKYKSPKCVLEITILV